MYSLTFKEVSHFVLMHRDWEPRLRVSGGGVSVTLFVGYIVKSVQLTSDWLYE